MPEQRRDDPFGGYNFVVSIKGVSDDGTIAQGSFTEASGLEVTMDPIEYRYGSDDITSRKLPGLRANANIVLKRGVTGDIDFWNWMLLPMKGQIDDARTEGSITLLDEKRDTVMIWNFSRAWPCKWTGPGMNATNGEVAMETLEICHEGLTIDGDNSGV